MAATVMALAACNTRDKEVDDFEAELSLKQSNSTIEVRAEEGSVGRLVFASNYNWHIETPEDVDWLTFDPVSGNAGDRITVKITAAENTGAERSAKCTVVSGASTLKFTVKQSVAVITLNESDIEDFDRLYRPATWNDGWGTANNWLRSDAVWSLCRSKQSEHFIVFWDKKYGEQGLYGDTPTSPKTLAASHSMYVDIDDLLEKAEEFFKVNTETLKFVDPSTGNSCVNKYKMIICILYQTEWLATGSGYDNVIGALWVNPSTCKPVGSTIGHEIGHCFQYMVYCDQLLAGAADNSQSGWRYGYDPAGINGSKNGNGFWEQCAQWQSFQTYKQEAFQTYYFPEYVSTTHLHTIHWDPRYAKYFIQWWWTREDMTYLAKLWNESKYPEDPNETHMRLQGFSMDEFNDDMWGHASHMVTWDIDEIREEGRNYIGQAGLWEYVSGDDGRYRVAVSKAPQTTGYNVIRLNNAAGNEVTVDFKGLTSAAGYNCGPAANAGWRYGFVAYCSDRTTAYSEPFSAKEGKSTWTVPANSERLWLVVTGAPSTYERCPWDETMTYNVWPYEVKFEGTDLYGNLTLDPSQKPQDKTFTYDLSIPVSAGYAGTTQEVDVVELANALVMQPADIRAKLGGDVKFVGVNPDGSDYTSGYTASSGSGFGYWHDADGTVIKWGGDTRVYTELNNNDFYFTVGLHPDKCSAGDNYTMRQAFVTKDARVTFVFNVTITR